MRFVFRSVLARLVGIVLGLATIVSVIPVIASGDGWPWSLLTRPVLVVVAGLFVVLSVVLNECLRHAQNVRAGLEEALAAARQDLQDAEARHAAPKPNDIALMLELQRLFPLRRSLADWLNAFDSNIWPAERQAEAGDFHVETENTHFLHPEVEIAWVELRSAMKAFTLWLHAHGKSDLSDRIRLDRERFPYPQSEAARDTGADLAEQAFAARITLSEVATNVGLLDIPEARDH